MIDRYLTNQLQLLPYIRIRIDLFQASSLIKNAKIGQTSQRNNMFHAMWKTYFLAYFPIYFFINSFRDDRLNRHIFDDVLQRDIEGDHVLVVLD